MTSNLRYGLILDRRPGLAISFWKAEDGPAHELISPSSQAISKQMGKQTLGGNIHKHSSETS
jgi:hypothetical protein